MTQKINRESNEHIELLKKDNKQCQKKTSPRRKARFKAPLAGAFSSLGAKKKS